MKIIAAVLFFVALAHSEKLLYSPEFFQKVADARLECANTEKVDIIQLVRLDSILFFPTSEELKCHTLCVMNKFKVLNDDHTLKMEELNPIFKDNILKNFLVTLEKCLPEDKKFDTCEKAYNTHRCVLKKL
ncbi:PREDICTED: uncharacterized protein LOC108562099 isoform X1 [Nicrophorus vespilloides]|uniref:Uncharacterized protein LOC108562099 isoform X1 n=1 Tax=Nicrophorus vespilloides TaxID=110193 RepID=A0ABM1MMJ2_NICVS|nr:PREDICTED: uncharacterized protein LOC108562099 isoform X1 [Nicrophorus vespilloides]